MKNRILASINNDMKKNYSRYTKDLFYFNNIFSIRKALGEMLSYAKPDHQAIYLKYS